MSRRIGLVVLCAVAFAQAASSVRIEGEGMQFSGFAGTVPNATPFAGVRLYANNDRAVSPATLPTAPSRYRVTIRGASTSTQAAGISLYLGTAKVGACTFTSTTPAICTLNVDVATQPSSPGVSLVLETDNGSNDTDIDWIDFAVAGAIPPPPPPPVVPSTGAFESRRYRNLFVEGGRDSAQVAAKLNAAFQQLFYGDDQNQRVYYPVGTDMAYIKDVGNGDVRSEGMSYGMMICVQMNRKAEFNRLWKWAKTYMYHADGDWKGYYAWQVSTSGTVMDQGSAPDGEEYFAMALFFASHRWGDSTGMYNYGVEARALLSEMLHHEERVSQYSGIRNMFNAQHKQVVFSPNNSSALFTDPSYHLPAFYELWARWAAADTAFWSAAADTSRAFFKRAVNARTGLGPDYAEFSGAANSTGNHADFRFDAWRTAQNIAMDYAWWAADPWQKQFADTILSFFDRQGIATYPNQYTLSGTALSTDHSPGLVAMNAVASLAATTNQAWAFVDQLWTVAIPTGQWRYYDGMLYMLGMLHVSGQFRIWMPGGTATHARVAPAGAAERSPLSGPARTTINGRAVSARQATRVPVATPGGIRMDGTK